MAEDLLEWIKKDTEACRPCLLSALVGVFVAKLETDGQKNRADRLKEVGLHRTPEQTAQLMDSIIQEVCEETEGKSACDYLKEATEQMKKAEAAITEERR